MTDPIPPITDADLVAMRQLLDGAERVDLRADIMRSVLDRLAATEAALAAAKREREIYAERSAANIKRAEEAEARLAKIVDIHGDYYCGVLTERCVKSEAERDAALAKLAEVTEERDAFRNDRRIAGQAAQDFRADALRAEAELAEVTAELMEEARLNGMGSEREARLMARLAESQKERDAAVSAGMEIVKQRDAALAKLAEAEARIGSALAVAKTEADKRAAAQRDAAAQRTLLGEILTAWAKTYGNPEALRYEMSGIVERIRDNRTTPPAAPAGDGWVRCEERMPGPLDRVLVYDGCYVYLVQCHHYETGAITLEDDNGWTIDEVTHWRPLPPPPTDTAGTQQGETP